MKKPHNNPYLYAGLTAVCVIVVAMLLVFIIFRYKDLANVVQVISAILQPFLIGSVLAYLLTPLCNRAEKFFTRILPDRKHKEKLVHFSGVFVSSAFAVIIAAILILLIVPATFNSIYQLIQSIPGYIMNLLDWINDKLKDYPQIRKYVLDFVDSVVEGINSRLQQFELSSGDANDLLQYAQQALSNLGSGISIVFKILLNTIIGFIISIYLLNSRKLFARQSKMTLYAMFKPRTADMIYEEVVYADKMFSGFFRGKVLDSAIVGAICFIAVKIMGIQDAMLISVIVGVTNIIPFFGPFIGAIPSALLIFVTDPKKCLYFCIFILILQQFDGNILGPKCMGSSINLSAFWVLFAILFFGGLFGFGGMLIGVPLFAVIYDILKKIIFFKLKKNGKEELIDDYDRQKSPPDTPQEARGDAPQETADAPETVSVSDISAETAAD
ncbi:Predicted PurR-regulated permease PerM [Ruminococcus sp. YE71]|uniref:AI-2E family transporter n=1 Tax=unclassified Ruminococcus TaxID=2608920 RepID=UPI000882B6D0|nr:MULTISPECIES: AI-2E family transporter [unclassified Ruminococcus]SDA29429.1 Predicted PurR-regulated permease PerM [Ruminococcus sp. YE78]SFW48268.1 Predicted PurR-regulated permease PerM [Ruminococcus sp. YE71]